MASVTPGSLSIPGLPLAVDSVTMAISNRWASDLYMESDGVGTKIPQVQAYLQFLGVSDSAVFSEVVDSTDAMRSYLTVDESILSKF